MALPRERVHGVDLHPQQQHCCGVRFSKGSCEAQPQRILCRVPRTWKEEFGSHCKYRFGSWGSCDGGLDTKSHQGTLKKMRYNAQCQETICITTLCNPETKSKGKKGKGKG